MIRTDRPTPPDPPARRPWLLIVSSLVLAVVFAVVFFGSYLPTRQRVAGLESEIREVYRKEVELQTRLAQSLQRIAFLEQQIAALSAERDALAQRNRDLEQQILHPRPPGRPVR